MQFIAQLARDVKRGNGTRIGRIGRIETNLRNIHSTRFHVVDKKFNPLLAFPVWGRSPFLVNEATVPSSSWGGLGWGLSVNYTKF